jgi:hypothetical protein
MTKSNLTKKSKLKILEERDKTSLKSFPPNFNSNFTCVSHTDEHGLLKPIKIPKIND